MLVRSDDREETANVARVTPAFFPGARASPMLGRIFTAQEFQAGSGNAVAVLSEDYWKEAFSGSPEVIGKTIEIDGRRYVIVGIGPPKFRFPGVTRLWIPDVK
jgi:putative ABC transport system permease protein